MQIARLTTTIRLYDPAVDHDRVDVALLQKFALRRDEKLLPLRPGMAPVRFHLRRISRRLWEWVEQASNEKERQVRAFRSAVVRIENFPIENDARIDWKPSGPLKDQQGNAVPIPEEDLTEERFAPFDMYEIGDAAYMQDAFPRDVVPQWRLLHSSAEVWDLMKSYQSADSSQAAPPPNSDAPKAPPEAPAAPSGDAPTAATAGATPSVPVASTSPSEAGPAALST